MDVPKNKLGVSRRTFLKSMATAAGSLAAAPYVPHLNFQQEVTLRWSMWSATPEETAVWQGLADAVTAAHPNITVNLETSSFSDYWGRLQTQLASGTEPDIIAMQSLRMPVFASRNGLRPLTPLIEADPDVNVDDFFEVIRDGMSYNGELYGFAYDLGPIMLYYNKDLFEAANVPFPSPTEPMSWDVFREILELLTDAENDQYGYAFQPGINTAIPWIWSAGGDYMDADATVCTLDSPEAMEALEYIVALIRDEQTAMPITDLANTNFASEAFYSGKVAMVQNGPWNFVNVRRNAEFNWDIAPLPEGPAGLTIPQVFSTFGTFLLRQFFLTIPDELEDAACIDGASRFVCFTRIILPLSKTALATLAVFIFLFQWNNLLWPLVISNTDKTRTLAVGLRYFLGEHGTDWNLLMAAATLATLPVMALYIFAQRWFVRGITLSGFGGR